MIKIQDDKDADPKRTMRTNDIPVGTTFFGTIWSTRDERWLRRLWLIAQIWNGEPICVCLDPSKKAAEHNDVGFHPVLIHCAEVQDYEPVTVNLSIEKVGA